MKKFLIALKADFSNKDLDQIPTFEPTTQPATEPEVAAKAKTKCKKYINEQIFKEYFSYASPSFLVKDLCESNQSKNDMI